jgi:hypothetical protein
MPVAEATLAAADLASWWRRSLLTCHSIARIAARFHLLHESCVDAQQLAPTPVGVVCAVNGGRTGEVSMTFSTTLRRAHIQRFEPTKAQTPIEVARSRA